MSPGVGFASLGSGSRGNATLVKFNRRMVLVDCGFGVRTVERRLRTLGHGPGDLEAIFVSHEHGDHIAGVAALAHKYAIPVFASYGTLKAVGRTFSATPLAGDQPIVLNPGHNVSDPDLEINPVTVPHDTREPTQFVFSCGGVRVGVLSDLGHVTPHVVTQFSGLDGLLMESNHDRGMLLQGRYPQTVKRRVAGDFGHLSNEQAAGLLERVAHPGMNVVIGHVSRENNHPDLLSRAFAQVRHRVARFGFADQDQGAAWVTVGANRVEST